MPRNPDPARTGFRQGSFGGAEQWGRRRSKLVQQRRLFGLGSLNMRGFDGAKPPDALRDGGKRHGQMMIFGPKFGQDLIEQDFVIRQKLALAAPLGGVTERIQPGAAQESQSMQ